jgi:hemolysin activation/secretion protein
VIDFNVGASHNLFPMGSEFPFPFVGTPSTTDRYSAASGYQTKDEFTVIRFGGSYATAVASDWLLRVAASGQYAQNALPAGEQLGLAGSNAVRGFQERAVAVDRGYFANFEFYSPDVAASIGLPGNMKWLAFFDAARGFNLDSVAANPQLNHRVNLASLGVGFRYNIKKDVNVRLDVARVMDGVWRVGSPAPVASDGDIRGHFSLAFGF